VEDRPDPVEIIARVVERDGGQRAFDVWVYKAKQAGWSVVVESASPRRPGTACGVVEIEGLRYRIHPGKHVRLRVARVPEGQHAIAAAVDLASGRGVAGVTWGWTFTHAAWAQPILNGWADRWRRRRA
jgi:hypothetical protein